MTQLMSNLPWLEEMSLTTLNSSRILLSASGEDGKIHSADGQWELIASQTLLCTVSNCSQGTVFDVTWGWDNKSVFLSKPLLTRASSASELIHLALKGLPACTNSQQSIQFIVSLISKLSLMDIWEYILPPDRGRKQYEPHHPTSSAVLPKINLLQEELFFFPTFLFKIDFFFLIRTGIS